MAWQTEAERRLVTFIEEEFGGNLATLLLSGRRGDAEAQRRSFILILADARGNRQVRFVEMGADGGALPRRQDPLVLAALLELLTGRGTIGRLAFEPSELLKALGWGASAEEVEAVEAALARYYATSFREVRERKSPFSRQGLECVAEQRIITGYDLEQELPRRGDKGEQPYMVVDFNPQFLDQLRRRSLFGIDWGLVRSITGPPDEE